MKLCNDTVTVFNVKLNPGTDMDVYAATVISGVSWFKTRSASAVVSGLKEADTVVVRIPINADFSGKSYISPVAYKNAAMGEINDKYTLAEGDLIVRGAVESAAPLTPSLLRASYDDVMTILSITDNRRAHAPHWKVVAH